MEILLPSKSGGVEVLFDGSSRSETMVHVFLVHGFAGSRFSRQRESLEQWVEVAAEQSSTAVTVHVVRFDASLMTSKGAQTLHHHSWGLREYLNQLMNEAADRLLEDNDGNNPANIYNTTSLMRPLPTTKRLLFIAHGLGSWIVKDVLASESSGNIAFVPTGVIFVDGLAQGQQSTETSYREYLSKTWTTFNLSGTQPQSETELVSQFLEIDGRFRIFESFYNAENNESRINSTQQIKYEVYLGKDLTIWMTEEPLSLLREPTWQNHLAGLVVWKTPARQRTSAFDELVEKLKQMFAQSANLQPSPQRRGVAFGRAVAISPGPTVETGLHQTHRSATGYRALDEIFQTDPNSLIPMRPTGFSARDLILSQPPTGRSTPVPQDLDAMSYLSTTPHAFMNKSKISTVYKIANSFFQKGDFKNAEDLLTELKDPDVKPLEKFETRMFIASIKLYRGNFQVAREQMVEIEKKLQQIEVEIGEKVLLDNLLYHCQRWMANHMLLTGDWKGATEKMETLLKHDPKRLHVRLYRDLALAYSHQGLYDNAKANIDLAERAIDLAINQAGFNVLTIADELDRAIRPSKAIRDKQEAQGVSANTEARQKQTEITTKTGKELCTKRWGVKVTAATIDMHRGNYSSAITTLSQALAFMKRTLGSKHPRTLSIANLQAWSLAYCSMNDEAETLSLATYNANRHQLGNKHPQTLNSMECLVHIFRSQSRFAEAVGTARSLDSLSKNRTDDLGHTHPQPVRAKYQLSRSHLVIGEYESARVHLADAISHAEVEMGTANPETLQLRSDLALVHLRRGNLNGAYELAFQVAIDQSRIYATVDYLPAHVTTNSPRQINHVSDLVNEIEKRTTVHPLLITTMRVLAEIEVKIFQINGSNDQNSHLQLAHKILSALQTHIVKHKPSDRALAMTVDFELASVLKEGNPKDQDLANAVELLEKAADNRAKILGLGHLDTLCAYRDLTIARCLRDPRTIATVKEKSDNLLKAFESRFGLLHPETLTSMLWCFTLDLLLPRGTYEDKEKLWEPIIARLEDPEVVRERFVESLLMKRRLAGLLQQSGYTAPALELVVRTLDEVRERKECSENQEFKETFSALISTMENIKEACTGL